MTNRKGNAWMMVCWITGAYLVVGVVTAIVLALMASRAGIPPSFVNFSINTILWPVILIRNLIGAIA